MLQILSALISGLHYICKMVFEIPLAEQKVKKHQVTALHLIIGFALVATAAFIITIFYALSFMPFTWEPVADATEMNIHTVLLPEYLLIGAGLIILFLAMFRNKWLLKNNNNKLVRAFELLLCVALSIYALTTAAHVIAGIFGVLAATIIFSHFVENTGESQKVVIDDKGIKLPISSRRRNINWAEIEQVLLRHGTLTIDCIDNRLYQWMTSEHDIDSESFESYCSTQVTASIGDRKKYNW